MIFCEKCGIDRDRCDCEIDYKKAYMQLPAKRKRSNKILKKILSTLSMGVKTGGG